MTNYILKPCPFCGAGITKVTEGLKVWKGQEWSKPVNFIVRHWCEKIDGQPSRMIERIGKDYDSAVAAWNMRYTDTGEGIA